MTGRWGRRLGVLVAGVLTAVAAALALAPAASAHPLGNFTVNQYSGLRVQPDGVTVDYLLDMAEVPAFQTRTQEIDADGNGAVSTAEQDRWRAGTCLRLSTQVTIGLAGATAPLTVVGSELTFPSGTAGLVTLRLGCTLRAGARVDRTVHVSYRDGAYTDRVGWREITAVGDRTTLTGSTVPATSSSGRLTAYPADLLGAPLDVRAAEFDARSGGARSVAAPPAAEPGTPQTRGVDRATSAFTALIGHRQLTVAFGLVAVLLSVLLGALHALAPGHGKTVMAAFLVGGRGTLRQAFTVGLTVTATHTVGVLVLGGVLTTSVALAPQRLYPWLGLVSGVLLAGVGVTLFRRARAGVSDHGHRHGHGHGHPHPHGDHAHPHGDHAHPHGDHAHPHGDHVHPHGDHAHPHGDHAHPHGDQVHAHGDHAHPHGDQVHAHGDHAHPHGNQVHAHGDQVQAHGDHAHAHPHGHPHDHDHAHPDDRHLMEPVELGGGRIPVAAGSRALVLAGVPGQPSAAAGAGRHDHVHVEPDRRHGADLDLPDHEQDHGHAGHGTPGPAGIGPTGGGPGIRRRALLLMGFAGGLVPSPSALVVLLGAVALGRTWFGVLLVIGYGAGMAAALMGIGLLLARGRRFLERRNLPPRALAVTARLPVLTAGLIVAVGLGLAAQAATALLAV